EEESAVENEEEESKNKYDVEKLGLKSRRKIPSSSRGCKGKNCLPEYDHLPRMSLLKQIPLSMSNRNKQQSLVAFKLTKDDEEKEEMNDIDEEKKKLMAKKLMMQAFMIWLLLKKR
ncbi:hypothetical protein WUBG_11033, partial [Wuchereria bancrofti]